MRRLQSNRSSRLRPPNSCYCAFCRSERVVYRKKHLSSFDVALNGLAGILVMLIIWQDFDPRFVVFSAVGLVISEFFVHMRWRISITCPKCGFDPVLYKKNKQLAADKVKTFMADRANGPLGSLNTPLDLPFKKVRKRAEPAQVSGPE